MDNLENIADELSRMVELNKRYLYGLYLFHETSPPTVKLLQRRAFKRTTKRVNRLIDQANGLLAKAQNGRDISRRTLRLKWPGWTGDMERRIHTMLNLYSELFDVRPMTPLADGELAMFKKYIADNL